MPTGRHVPFAQSPLFLFAMNTPCGGCGPISGPTHSIDKQHDRGVSTHLYFCKTREGLAPQFSSFAEVFEAPKPRVSASWGKLPP